MKSSEILRTAARIVERGNIARGGCYAIDIAAAKATNSDYAAAIKAFNVIKPRGVYEGHFWWDAKYRHGPRIIGLCLAAAIAESDGD